MGTCLSLSSQIGAVGFLLATAVACSEQKPPPVKCSARPAFTLVVTADSGPLPADLLLRVQHGGGCEMFSLKRPASAAPCMEGEEIGVLFCQIESPEAGAAPDNPRRLECELWTEGAATVGLETTEFPHIERVLQAEQDECGFTTVHVAINLAEPDASAD